MADRFLFWCDGVLFWCGALACGLGRRTSAVSCLSAWLDTSLKRYLYLKITVPTNYADETGEVISA